MNRMTTTVFGLALIVLLCGAASATDIYVNQTGWWNATADTTFHAIAPGQIQAAVDDADTGDKICVKAGAYNENVKVNKWLTLEGAGADVVTVTAAAANDHVFNVTADYVNITGFTVTGATGDWSIAGVYLSADHCNISDNVASDNGAGIVLGESNNNALTGNDCSGNGYYGIVLTGSNNNNTLTGNNCSGNGGYGIWLWYSNNNNTLTGNDCSGNGVGICIWLYGSNNNNTLTGNDCSGNGYYGIWLYGSSNNNTLTGNDCSGNGDTGIRLDGSNNNNTLTGNDCSGNGIWGIVLTGSNNNNTLTGNDCSGNDQDGIVLWYSNNNNTLTGNDCSGNGVGIRLYGSSNNTLTGNDCSGNGVGIRLYGSSNNTLTGNDCSGNGIWGFYSDENSHNNTVEDLTVASYPTTISFTYENGIAITGVETPPADPAGKTNITRYVNATNVTAESWLFLNVSYNESDLAGLDESSLRMWRRHDGAWSEVAGSGVNEAENYVYANITEFSVFAPMGDPEPTPYPTPSYPPGYKSVPALTPPGMILLIGLMLVAGFVTMRRRE